MIIPVNEIPPEVPVGTILSWVLRVDNDGGEIVDLPDGWMRCDGSVIPHGSIWTGKNVPNLNGERRFLRGGTDEDMLKMEEDQMQDHSHDLVDPGHGHAISPGFYNKKFYKGQGSSGAQDREGGTPSTATTSAATGITVAGVTAGSGRYGDETRPRNMNVIYIIRVW